jgi:hypothetical protein
LWVRACRAKAEPVLLDTRQNKDLEQDRDSKKSHLALVPTFADA